MKNVLLIIDMQYDFCNPNGSLYVKDAEKAVGNTIGLTNTLQNRDILSDVIFTRDWHIEKHPSFVEQGGQWPPHCIQKTRGVGIDENLIVSVAKIGGCKTHEVHKGEFVEQYGAFNSLDDTYKEIFDNAEHIYVVGVAGDYCVKTTIMQLISYSYHNKIVVIDDCIASIDVENYDNFVTNCSLKRINSEQL